MKQVLTPLLVFFVMAVSPLSAQQTGSFNWILGLENIKTGDVEKVPGARGRRPVRKAAVFLRASVSPCAL